jgi:hypothetical protein
VVKQSQNTPDPKRIFGIIGIIELSRGPYLVVIKSRKEVGLMDGNKIWKIGSTEIHPLYTETAAAMVTLTQAEDDKKYLALVKQILSLPLYFSYDFDITNTYQRRAAWTKEKALEPLYKKADIRFWWNRYLLAPFLNPVPTSTDGVPSATPDQYSRFILPVMMGFIEIHHIQVRGTLVEFALFSRRHTRRAGCRYVVRGIDASGAVANFVETEQVVVLPERKLTHAFVILRGSIPVFWTQLATLKYAPVIAVQTKQDVDAAFNAHFGELANTYGKEGPFVCTSLINLKGSELKLADQFAAAVQRCRFPNVEYYPFDFHKECPGTNYTALQRLLSEIQPSMDKSGWFIADNAQHTEGPSFRAGSVLRVQSGAVRVNCIDNLDRTNVGQSVFAKHVLLQQLQVLGLIPPETKLEDLVELKKAFQNTWADNANSLATQYAGTGALKVDFTRNGKRSFGGMLMDGYNSLMRYILNNFKDGVKQDAFNLFLGVYRVDPKAKSPFAADKGREQIINFFLVLFVLLFGTGFTRYITFSPYVAAGYWVAFLGIYAAGITLYGKKLVNLPVLTRNRTKAD